MTSALLRREQIIAQNHARKNLFREIFARRSSRGGGIKAGRGTYTQN
jgi:hypothetical protein